MLEWTVVGIAIVGLLGVAWFFAIRADSTPHNGAGETPAATGSTATGPVATG